VRERRRGRRIAPEDTPPLDAGQTGKEGRQRKHVPDQSDCSVAQHDSWNAGPVLPFEGHLKTGVAQKMRTAVSRNTIAANGDT
jgi:hypothetical protein